MENASKALLIAAAVLVAIILITIGIKIYSSSDAQRVAIDTGNGITEKTKDATDFAISQITGKSSGSANGNTNINQGGNTEESGVVQLQPGETAPNNTNAIYNSGSYTAVIPAGYTISNVEGEQSIENGLVIKKNGNEWVWIPVSSNELVKVYTEDSMGWKMSEVDVITKYRSLGTVSNGNISFDRGNPGTTSLAREPDVLTSLEADNDLSNLRILGFNNLEEMALSLKNDYNNMIESVKKNGGFYIGRYELSNEGIKKGKRPLTTNWYYLYSKCVSLGDNSVESRMVWGCSWDLVCNFISNYGDKINLGNYRSYGNYYTSEGLANIEGSGTLQVTGFSDYWKMKNIYDIAGNCSEWTQEADRPYYRLIRDGGCTSGYHKNWYIKNTFINTPKSSGGTTGSRSILYIK